MQYLEIEIWYPTEDEINNPDIENPVLAISIRGDGVGAPKGAKEAKNLLALAFDKIVTNKLHPHLNSQEIEITEAEAKRADP